MNRKFCLWGVFFALVFSCNSPFTPKPQSYPFINFPIKKYVWKNVLHSSFKCKIPVYAHFVEEKTTSSKPKELWANLFFSDLGAKIYLTYKTINNDLDILIKDCYAITFKQEIKATIIQDSSFTTPNNYKGVFFYVGGDAATKYQFFITDEKKHFLRGSLYFDISPNEDSLAIVHQFLRSDIDTFINTFLFATKP